MNKNGDAKAGPKGSTEEIARRHGHTGPTRCQECGTTEGVHFGSWFDPGTEESGSFLLCCSCGIKGGDAPADHLDCNTPATQLVPHEGSTLTKGTYEHIRNRAAQAYTRGSQDATHHLGLSGDAVHQHALSAVLADVGIAYAAAAIHLTVQTLADRLDENALSALDELAAALDLEVVEGLIEPNAEGAEDPSEPRVFHRSDGWNLNLSEEAEGPERCTSNHFREQDGRPPCTSTAAWEVVTVFNDGMGLTLAFYCDADLPEEYRSRAAAVRGEA